jgi:hypothetical protein
MMAEKLSDIKESILNLDTLMTLLEVLQQLDNVDLLGNEINMKMKVINKIDSLIDKI